MKNILTKLIALMLVVCSLFTLTACGDTGSGGGTGGSGGGHVHDYIDHVCSCGDVEKYTEGLKFKENTKGGMTVIGFEEGATVPETVYVPQKHNGKKVTAVGQGAFEGATFTQIVLPEGIEVIYGNAFKNCMITSIELPASLTKIHPYAFETEHLKSAIFKATTGWYVTRHNPTNKPLEDGTTSDYFKSATTNAERLTDCDTSNKGKPSPGACFWTRFN